MTTVSRNAAPAPVAGKDTVQVAHTPAALRMLVSPGKGKTVLVPTMGALHAGHLALVKHAKTLGDCVIVSIYVNPLQFSPDEDFHTYPRRLADDCDKLAGLADIVYAPGDATMYPEEQTVRVALPPMADELCGKTRPSFFHGVATVVCKLFNQVRPDVAVFGAKDYQQAVVVQIMTRQFNMPIAIDIQPTVRDADGLAVSSRNEYLSATERQSAPVLYATLRATGDKIAAGNRDWRQLCEEGEKMLTDGGLKCDYFTIRGRDLSQPGEGDVVILGAAWAGKTRLIDNVQVSGE